MKNFKITFVETRHAASLLGVFVFIAVTLTSCFNYDEPPRPEPANVDSNLIITIADLKQMHDGAPVTIRDSVFIAGRVISSDRQGNIFREMFIQDSTAGLRIRVGRSGLYNFYSLGQRIYIKLQGLTIGNNNGTLELGTRSANPSFQTGFIEVPWLINRHILPGIQQALVEPTTVTLEQVNDTARRKDLVGTLVRLENLTFRNAEDDIPTWANPNPGDGASPQTVNQFFADGTIRGFDTIRSTDGTITRVDTLWQSIIVRTSGHARFAGERIPTTPVDIVGILTVFGNSQIGIRDLNDVTPR